LKRLFAYDFYRNRLLRILLGPKDWKNLQAGRARNAGEVHKWMYDRITLGNLLKKLGFKDSIIRTGDESGWEAWSNQNLDMMEGGGAVHANSLYMEAVKG
jgi:hypothetical protein